MATNNITTQATVVPRRNQSRQSNARREQQPIAFVAPAACRTLADCAAWIAGFDPALDRRMSEPSTLTRTTSEPRPIPSPGCAGAILNIATPLRPAACRIAASSTIVGDRQGWCRQRIRGQELRCQRNRCM